MTSAKRQREKFKKYVKTSGQTYGNGTVYFCEGDDVVTLEEENFTFDEAHLATAIGIEWVAAEDGQVRILADFNRAETSIEAELFRRVQRDRKSTRLNSSHALTSRMPSSA